MGVGYNPRIVTNNLSLYLDAGNTRSYPGSGTTWTDLSGSGNALTLTNSPTFTSGIGYFTFNGTNQYAITTTLPSSTVTNFSMCAIVRPSNLTQVSYIVHNGIDTGVSPPYTGYGLVINATKFQFLYSNIAYSNTGYTFPSASAWYYLVATRDTTTSRFYVNAVQTLNTYTTTPVTPTTHFTVGSSTAASFFSGDISVVSFYTKQLTDKEIRQNFNALRGRYGI